MDINTEAPEHTAVRVALWRALHVEVDPGPHVFEDAIGAQIVGESNWQKRPDMKPDFCKSMRASIVGRARFIEDLVVERLRDGVAQYVILGAGLDTFAQRRHDLLAHLRVFEVDQPGPQAWKQRRLKELSLPMDNNLRFVPVNFEKQSWWERLLASGFDPKQPSVVVSTGVSMYLSREANFATLKQISKLTAGSTFAMTFLLALELLEPNERASMEFVMNKARESGTPFLSLFFPPEILNLAREARFIRSDYVSAKELFNKYFLKRTDQLNGGTAEGFLLATT